MTLTESVEAAFAKAFPGLGSAGARVVPATNPKFGDYQCNDALKIAGKAGMKPRDAAALVAENIDKSLFDKVEVAGPGFLNLTVSAAWLSDSLSGMEGDPFLGIEQTGKGKRIVIDYSSPNAAKQMHIGHIRSTVIGNAIDRIFRALGYDVVADNHLGDWGTQFGILIKGYRELLSQEERDNLTVANLEKCYVLSAAKAKEEDGVWREACKQELVKLQRGDKDNLALWKRFIDISIGEFDRMYAKLGVKFDTYRGESYYNDMMPGVVEDLVARGLAVESEGALVVNLDAEKLGVAIVRKSDGGYNYTTSDLACVKSRIEEYAPERIVYVTDARQQLHFKQWFSIAAKTGCKTTLVHVPFGLMSYQGKAISTREGNLIKLDELLAEAVKRSLAIVMARRGTDGGSAPEPRACGKDGGSGAPEPRACGKDGGSGAPGPRPTDDDIKLAEAIGYGAVKYSDLSHDPITDIDFSWDKALALEGNSGPYLQYAYARVCSLMEKVEKSQGSGVEKSGAVVSTIQPFNLSTSFEKRLALQLLEFPGAVRRAAEAYKPSILADYLYQTAQTYSSFYQNTPVLKSEEPARSSRLRLCALAGRVLSKGLGLLGIETPSHI